MTPYATLNGSMVVNDDIGMGDEIEDLVRGLCTMSVFYYRE